MEIGGNILARKLEIIQSFPRSKMNIRDICTSISYRRADISREINPVPHPLPTKHISLRCLRRRYRPRDGIQPTRRLKTFPQEPVVREKQQQQQQQHQSETKDSCEGNSSGSALQDLTDDGSPSNGPRHFMGTLKSPPESASLLARQRQ